MRAAPPCTVWLGSGQAERLLVTALYGIAGSVLSAWLATALPAAQPAVDMAGTLGFVVTGALTAVAAGALWGIRPLGPWSGGGAPLLHWSGRQWHLLPTPSDVPGPENALSALRVTIDLGPWLLLRARRPAAPDRWLVARPAPAGAAGWAALRVALAAQAERPAAALDDPTRAT